MYVRQNGQNLVCFHSASSKVRMRVAMLKPTSFYRDKHCIYLSKIKKYIFPVRFICLIFITLISEKIRIHLIFPERRQM